VRQREQNSRNEPHNGLAAALTVEDDGPAVDSFYGGIERGDFMRMAIRGLCSALLLFAALAGTSFGPAHAGEAQQTPAARPPNIVVIFTDDQGYGDLGSYGHPTIRTPNIDRLAAEGQRWTSFYAAPVCTPSRAQLLTGRLSVRTGLASGVLFPDSQGGLQPEEITIPEVLKTRGYATIAIGKWHLGVLPRYLPTSQGFDSYFGIPYSNDMDMVADGDVPGGIPGGRFGGYMNPKTEYFRVPLMRNEKVIERPADQTTITQRYTDEAISFIKANRQRPFFVYLAHNMPHMPLFRSREFEGRSQRGKYGDVIEELDANVGRLVQTLRDLQLDRQTLVVFTSDNGPWSPYLEQGGSAGLLRGAKGSTWEGGMREPAIFWWPGTIKPAVITGIGSELDFLQTFAALAGATPPSDRPLDGNDLSATLKTGAPSPRQTLFYYASNGGYPAPLVAVRRGSYKLHLRAPQEGRGGGAAAPGGPDAPKVELYNLDEDPSEKFDLSSARADKVSELRGIAEEHQKAVTPGPNQLGRGQGRSSGGGRPAPNR
jgi:arylsulfatase A-like enzyme